MSAKSLQHRWKHELQIGLRAPPLVGADDDDDADAGTETTTPDDDEDIASLTSQQSTVSSAALKLRIVARSPFLVAACSLMSQHVLQLETLFEDHGVCSVPRPRAAALRAPPWLSHHFHPHSWSVGKRRSSLSPMLFPPHAGEFTLQVLELTHIWSGSDSDVTEPDDILAVVPPPSTCSSNYIFHRSRGSHRCLATFRVSLSVAPPQPARSALQLGAFLMAARLVRLPVNSDLCPDFLLTARASPAASPVSRPCCSHIFVVVPAQCLPCLLGLLCTIREGDELFCLVNSVDNSYHL